MELITETRFKNTEIKLIPYLIQTWKNESSMNIWYFFKYWDEVINIWYCKIRQLVNIWFKKKIKKRCCTKKEHFDDFEEYKRIELIDFEEYKKYCENLILIK